MSAIETHTDADSVGALRELTLTIGRMKCVPTGWLLESLRLLGASASASPSTAKPMHIHPRRLLLAAAIVRYWMAPYRGTLVRGSRAGGSSGGPDVELQWTYGSAHLVLPTEIAAARLLLEPLKVVPGEAGESVQGMMPVTDLIAVAIGKWAGVSCDGPSREASDEPLTEFTAASAPPATPAPRPVTPRKTAPAHLLPPVYASFIRSDAPFCSALLRSEEATEATEGSGGGTEATEATEGSGGGSEATEATEGSGGGSGATEARVMERLFEMSLPDAFRMCEAYPLSPMCNLAMGRAVFATGALSTARTYFRRAIMYATRNVTEGTEGGVGSARDRPVESRRNLARLYYVVADAIRGLYVTDPRLTDFASAGWYGERICAEGGPAVLPYGFITDAVGCGTYDSLIRRYASVAIGLNPVPDRLTALCFHLQHIVSRTRREATPVRTKMFILGVGCTGDRPLLASSVRELVATYAAGCLPSLDEPWSDISRVAGGAGSSRGLTADISESTGGAGALRGLTPDIGDTRALVHAVLRIDPNNHTALTAQFYSGLDTERIPDRILRLRPWFAESHIVAALHLSKAGRNQDALRVIDNAIVMAPGASNAYIIRARIHRTLGDIQKALSDATVGLSRARTKYGIAMAHRELSSIHFHQTDVASALLSINECISRTPYDIDALRRRASYNRALHLPERVIQDAQTILKMSPNDVYGLNVLSDSYRLLGDIPNAICAARTAISLDSKSAMAYCMLGHALLMVREFGAAETAATQAIELSHNYGAALFVRATAKRMRGDTIGAQQDARRAIEVDPALRVCHNLHSTRAA